MDVDGEIIVGTANAVVDKGSSAFVTSLITTIKNLGLTIKIMS